MLRFGVIEMDQEKLNQVTRSSGREKATVIPFEAKSYIQALDFKKPRVIRISATCELRPGQWKDIVIKLDLELEEESYDVFWNAMKKKTPLFLQVTESKTKSGSTYRLESFREVDETVENVYQDNEN